MEIETNAENQQRIKDCFNFYDRDYDGKIDIRQLGTLIRSLGCAPTEDEIKQYINVNRAIKEAEKQQRLFDRVGNASDAKSKFSVEIVQKYF